MFLIGKMEGDMLPLGEEDARAFGRLVRDRRKALGLRQEDVVLATGVGRRYLIELEAGKPTARLGPALMIARQLGIVPALMHPSTVPDKGYGGLPTLPDLPPAEE
jgi:transcriptional regulator with XRE-family HTH domain